MVFASVAIFDASILKNESVCETEAPSWAEVRISIAGRRSGFGGRSSIQRHGDDTHVT